MLEYETGFFFKDPVHKRCGYKWPAKAVVIEPDAAFTKFGNIDGNGRYKNPQYAFHRIGGNAPDAEKTQYMINAEGIEIIAHLFEPPAPPDKTILLHALPVVGGETPVLSFHCKIVRGCARLPVHIVQFRCRPGI